MKKRLRKKKHMGEFTEYGFYLRGTIVPIEDFEDSLEFVDKLVEHISTMGLEFGGAIGKGTIDLFVCRWEPPKGRATATEEDKQRLVASLLEWPEVLDLHASELVDVWNGAFDD